MKKIHSSFLFFALSLGLLWSANPVEALTVSPVKLELAGDPGQTVTGTFDLMNEQDSEMTFYVSFSNFEAQGETGSPNFVDSDEGLATWMHLVPEESTSVTLASGEVQTFTYQIDIPADAAPGGNFGAIFWGTNPAEQTDDELGLALGAKVGILVFLTVSGDIEENGGFLEFDTLNGQRVFNELPVSFFYRIQNSGGDRIIPMGTIKIKNLLGMSAAEISVNAEQSNVLPTSIRRYEEIWGAAPTEDLSFWDHVNFQWDNFALGYYKANLNVSFGADGIGESKVGFWVLPWQLLIVVGSGTLIFLSFAFFGIRRYNRWIIASSKSVKKKRK